MTLTQLADFVCAKVNQQQDEDKAICKDFLRRRLDMIWNDALWKDTLIEYSVAIDPTAIYAPDSVYLPTKGVLLLPLEFDRVLAVRTGERALNVVRPEMYYRRDIDVFNKSGTPWEFIVLPPCVWEFDDECNVSITREFETDSFSQVTIDTLSDSNTTDVGRSLITLSSANNLVGITERIDATLKPTTNGTVSIATAEGVLYVNSADIDYYFVPVSTPLVLCPDYRVFDPSTLVPANSSVFSTNETLLQFGRYILIADASTGQRITEISGPDPSELIRGTVTYDGSSATFESGFETVATVLVLSASETTARPRERIRFLYKPDGAATIRVLGKRRCPTFTNDNDQPPIRGMDNALIAFVQGDMLERERQYGKAGLKFQEGTALLDQLKAIETVQQAHNLRVAPDAGYGDPNDQYNTPPLSY
jgi:hypothetical protein